MLSPLHSRCTHSLWLGIRAASAETKFQNRLEITFRSDQKILEAESYLLFPFALREAWRRLALLSLFLPSVFYHLFLPCPLIHVYCHWFRKNCVESPPSPSPFLEKKEGVEVGSSLSANREIRRAYTYIRRRKVLWTERVPLKCYVEALMPSVMVLGGNQE